MLNTDTNTPDAAVNLPKAMQLAPTMLLVKLMTPPLIEEP